MILFLWRKAEAPNPERAILERSWTPCIYNGNLLYSIVITYKLSTSKKKTDFICFIIVPSLLFFVFVCFATYAYIVLIDRASNYW